MIKMSWRNPYALGNIALGCGCYSMTSQGCASVCYESAANGDVPLYARGFYSATQHEALSEVIYNRTEIGYDKDLREIQRVIDGAPLEAYVPSGGALFDDSGSAVPKTGEVIEPIVIKNPEKRVVDEILKAQREVSGQEIILQEVEIEEIIIKRRRVRSREIKFKKKGQNSEI